MITICKSFSFGTRIKPQPSKDETICKSFSMMPTGYLAADGKDLGEFVPKRSSVVEVMTFGVFDKDHSASNE